MWSTYSNLSLVPTRSKQAPTPGRSFGDKRQSDLVVVLGHFILPLSQQPWSRGERFQPSDYTATSAYWAHIPACDRYVQCLLAEANPSVLNRHRRGLHLWMCRFSTYHSLTFPTDGLHFSLKGPARSQVIQAQHKPLAIKIKAPSRWVTSMPLDLYRILQLRLAITNDPSLAIGITRIDWKGILMHLGHQSNSYNLMHKQESQPRFKYKQNSMTMIRCTRACLDPNLD
jgi:hypothetical protein